MTIPRCFVSLFVALLHATSAVADSAQNALEAARNAYCADRAQEITFANLALAQAENKFHSAIRMADEKFDVRLAALNTKRKQISEATQMSPEKKQGDLRIIENEITTAQAQHKVDIAAAEAHFAAALATRAQAKSDSESKAAAVGYAC